MELRRVVTRARKSESGRRSAQSMPTTPAVVEASLQWVTARIPPALVREIEAHAKCVFRAIVSADSGRS